MADDLVPARDPWQQLDQESNAEYHAFSQYCSMGPSRTLKRLAAHVGISHEQARQHSRKHKWVDRAKLFDQAANELVPTDIDMSLQETQAFQFAVGKAMLELGIRAINLKRPGSLSAKDAISLIKQGSDMQRKVLGLDNPNVQINITGGKSFGEIDALFDELEELESVAVEDEDES